MKFTINDLAKHKKIFLLQEQTKANNVLLISALTNFPNVGEANAALYAVKTEADEKYRLKTSIHTDYVSSATLKTNIPEPVDDISFDIRKHKLQSEKSSNIDLDIQKQIAIQIHQKSVIWSRKESNVSVILLALEHRYLIRKKYVHTMPVKL